MAIGLLTFQGTIDSFISNRNLMDTDAKSNVTYLRKLKIFKEYLEVKKSVNENNFVMVLKGLDNQNLLDSVEYYVERYNISFTSTVDNYLEAILAYLKYLNNNENFGKLEIPCIESSSNEVLLRKDFNNQKVDLELEQTDKKYPYNEEQVIKIIRYCNNIIDNFDINSLNTYSKKYNNPCDIFISAIATKLVMFTGIKNIKLNELKISNYDKVNHIIKIGKISFALSDRYIRDLDKYLSLREMILKNDTFNELLIVKRSGEAIGGDNSYAFKAINNVIKSSGAEKLAKVTIIEMLKQKIDIYSIKKSTGFGLLTCLHCQEILNTEKEEVVQEEYNVQKIDFTSPFDIE